MAHYNLRSDVVTGSHPSSGGHPFGSNPPDIVKILSDDLLNDVSQISDQYEPVCKRKVMTSYKYGTCGTSNGSEYEPSKASENKTDKEKSRDSKKPKRKKLTLRKR